MNTADGRRGEVSGAAIRTVLVFSIVAFHLCPYPLQWHVLHTAAYLSCSYIDLWSLLYILAQLSIKASDEAATLRDR
jgi:hypothetical protein